MLMVVLDIILLLKSSFLNFNSENSVSFYYEQFIYSYPLNQKKQMVTFKGIIPLLYKALSSLTVSVGLIILASFNSLAQSAPELMRYQAVARNSFAQAVTNQAVTVRVSILGGTTEGPVIFSETHNPITSDLGLFSIQIGNGTALVGSINDIDWGGNAFFLQVELDVLGGSAFSLLGVSELVSVPYTLYASESGTAGPMGPTGPTGQDGVEGAPGAHGPQGTSGSVGAIGPPGVNGVTGAEGIAGINGTMGALGPVGPSGADGQIITGPNGLSGEDAQLPTGTTGQTIFHTGVTWSASSTLTNNGNAVGVGVPNPNTSGDPESAHVKGNLLMGDGTTTADSYIVGDLDLSLMTEANLKLVSDANDNSDETVSDIVFGAGSSSSLFGPPIANYGSTPRLEYMRINASEGGKVGIANPSPSNQLSVNGNADVSGKLAIGTSTSLTPVTAIGFQPIRFGLSEDPSEHARLFANSFYYGFLSGSGQAALMMRQNTGRVGIGTYQPATTLDVEGGIMVGMRGSTVFSPGIPPYSVTLNVPLGWDDENLYVLAAISDGEGELIEAYVEGNQLHLIADLHTNLVRINWVIFRI